MKVVRIVCCLFVLLMGLLAISPVSAILAQDETPIEEGLVISAKYPKVKIISGESAEFEVNLRYRGEMGGKPRVFDLLATGPKDWYVYITPSYPKDKRIASIELRPGLTLGEEVRVVAVPAYWLMPEPGEYTITLEVTSLEPSPGEIKGTFELTAVVTAKHTLALAPTTERYNTTVKAGKDNYFPIEVQNQGTAAIDNIILSSSKPEGWTIKFTPDKIDSLSAIDFQTIDVNIKPPSRTVAGDYAITLRASGKQATAEKLDIRVTVETPTIWGWVGVGIIVLVIAGLAVVFMRVSRR